jgi:hypothetical protein
VGAGGLRLHPARERALDLSRSGLARRWVSRTGHYPLPVSRAPNISSPPAVPADIGPVPAQSGEMTVSDPDTAIHSGPGENSQVLDSIGVGTKVMVLDSAHGWTHIIAGGEEGYISSDSLK